MATSQSCPQCGQELPPDAPAGLCPACLLGQGQADKSAGDPAPTSASGGRFSAPTPQELAERFPQLEILELLGQGGMGAVYKARQPGLDRLVAVKILPPEISRDPAFAERFQREARALARLSHPHIVAVYDFGVVGQAFQPDPLIAQGQAGKPDLRDGLCYIVMEFVDGANLRQAIRAGKLAAAEALAIVPQICEALQFAHDEGIVHRDIKPENILIDKRGRVKIADFGLAKLKEVGQPFQADSETSDARVSLERLTYTGQVMGTLRYMAPEQMQGSREVDHRADIYSLGVVFYELLTGELPMGKFAPPSKRVQVDVRLDEVVLRALEQDPEQRYQHASEVKTDVETISRSRQPESVARPESVKDAATGPRLVQAPADCLLLAAGIAFVTACGVALWVGVPARLGRDVTNFTNPMIRGNLTGMSVGLAIYSVFVGVAGLMLRRLRVRLFVLLVAVIVGLFFPAVIALNVVMELRNMPVWPVVIPLWLGMPAALWVAVRLFRDDVRRAFDAAAKQRAEKTGTDSVSLASAEPAVVVTRRRIPLAAWIGVVPFVVIYVAASAELQNQGDATTVRAVAMASLCFAAVYLSVYAVIALVRRSRRVADQQSRAEPRPWRIAMFFSLLLFFTALFVINWVGKPFGGSAAIGHSERTRPTGQQTTAPKTGDEWFGDKGAEHVMFWGPDSPTVSDRLARHLGLDPSQRAAMDRAFQMFVREFKALEEQNTQHETDANGHQITTIAELRQVRPYLTQLVERFWSELHSALDGRQLKLARKVVWLNAGMFATGDYGYRIEIWRVSQTQPLYHWKESYSGLSAGQPVDVTPSSGPELPEKLRRFWKEPEASGTPEPSSTQ